MVRMLARTCKWLLLWSSVFFPVIPCAPNEPSFLPGLALSDDFAIYQHRNSSGFAKIGDDLYDPDFPTYDVPLSAPLDEELSTKLLQFMQEAGEPVNGLQVFGGSEDVALRWGEVIPMWFYKQFVERTKSIIFSIPTRSANSLCFCL